MKVDNSYGKRTYRYGKRQQRLQYGDKLDHKISLGRGRPSIRVTREFHMLIKSISRNTGVPMKDVAYILPPVPAEASVPTWVQIKTLKDALLMLISRGG